MRIAVASLTVVAAVACGGNRGTNVAIVGDSIANLVVCDHVGTTGVTSCRSPYTTQPSSTVKGSLGSSVAVRAHDSQRIDQMLADASALAASHPRLMIEDLGANDAAQGNAAWMASFDALASFMLEAKCAVFTTVPEAAGLPVADQINAAVMTAVATHATARVVDWYGAVRANGVAFSADGVHPTTAAAQQWILGQWKAAEDACP